MTDAFAEAAAQTAAPASAPAQAQVGTAAPESVKADYAFGGVDDPFLTSSDVNTGGAIGPRVSLDDVIGRLVVMIPQLFTEKAQKPERFRKNADDLFQPVADVDFFVLDGPLPFSFEWQKPAPTAADPNAKEYVTETVTEFPYVEKGKRLFNAGLSWSVKRTMDQRGILMGVMAYGPANRKSGGDIDSVSAAMQDWIKRGRKGDRPQSTYVLDDRPHVLTPQRRSAAGAWWSEYRKTL